MQESPAPETSPSTTRRPPETPLRIAFVGTRGIPANYGGFETAVEEVATRLAQRGHEAIVYCRSGNDTERRSEYRGVRLVSLPSLGLRSAETLSHTLLSLLHLIWNPVDVALVFNPANGPLTPLLRLRGIPWALNLDGLEWRRRKWSRLGRRYLRFAARLSARFSTALVADSRGIQDYYSSRFGKESVLISYGAAINTSRRPELLEDLGLEPNDYYLVVARLEPENNTDWVLREFAKLDTDKRLVVVGGVNYSTPYLEQLRRTEDDRVVFTGGIYDQEVLNEVLCNCFAYVHGHEVGGTNPILLQALGSSCCVIYRDNVFNREVAGEAGIAVDSSDGALCQALESLERDPKQAERYRPLGPPRIRARYTWDQVADGYEALCVRLSRRHRRTSAG